MFDEQPAAPEAPSTPAKPVEDMFDGLASPTPQSRPSNGSLIVSPPSILPRVDAVARDTNYQLPTTDYEPQKSHHLLKAILILLVVIILVGGAAFAAWRIMSQTSNSGGVVQSVPSDTNVNPPPVPEPAATTSPPSNPATQPAANQASFLDTDGDGLANADELAAGTSSSKPDTDGDGLGDREEVKVYGTNPLKADTDGDGFTDGVEVSGGYNPNGPGKLFTVPTN